MFNYHKSSILALGVTLGAVTLAAAQVELEPIALGLETATGVGVGITSITHAGDGSGRLFATEKTGEIYIIDPEGIAEPRIFLDLGPNGMDRVRFDTFERGLLGLAFHPDFPATNRFFVMYTGHVEPPLTDNDQEGDIFLSEFAVSADPNVAIPNERIILRHDDDDRRHNGGTLQFGPEGLLWFSIGDDFQFSQTSQFFYNLEGKISRIDIDNVLEGETYAIPPNNPFVGQAGARGEIYAIGFRNPWKFWIDIPSGNTFVADVGENLLEEVNLLVPGGNYGWSVFEGSVCRSGGCSEDGFIFPIHQYDHSDLLETDLSITGGVVYRGVESPPLEGKYIFGDWGSGRIWSLEQDALSPEVWNREELINTDFAINTFGVDASGEIYLGTGGFGSGSDIYRLHGPHGGHGLSVN